MTPEWRKSSRSGTSGSQSDCVEVAKLPRNIGVRDSKAPELGHLTVSYAELGRLVGLAKAGELDLK